MAEPLHILQSLQEQHNFHITLAFRELAERWRNIFDQKMAETYQAGKEWRLAQTQARSLSWDPYPKPLATAVEELRTVVADLGTLPPWATHTQELPPVLLQQHTAEDRPYDALDDLAHGTRELHPDDERLAERLVLLQDRIDALDKDHPGLEHAQVLAQERQQEQGIGY